jgi:putative transposase
MRNIHLATSEIYHIYNRGVDKRNIFVDINDYKRFVEGLVVFNDKNNLSGRKFKALISGEDRSTIVNIIVYCLMPNHFHLLLEQIEEGGITFFVKKFTTSYTMYFNKKYERSGALIQGVFKRSHVKSNDRLLEMSRYIHTNPKKILPRDMEHEIASYPWSSLPDYLGKPNPLPVVSNKEIILDQFKTTNDYYKFILGLT